MFISFNVDPSLMPFEMRRRAWLHAREEARAAYRAWVRGRGARARDRLRASTAPPRSARRRLRAPSACQCNPQPSSGGLTPGRRVCECGYGSVEPVATRIELCGALTVEVDGRRVEDDLPGRQGRLLFAYLALNRERPVRRDELVDVVWDDEPARLARRRAGRAAHPRCGARSGPTRSRAARTCGWRCRTCGSTSTSARAAAAEAEAALGGRRPAARGGAGAGGAGAVRAPAAARARRALGRRAARRARRAALRRARDARARGAAARAGRAARRRARGARPDPARALPRVGLRAC